MSELNEQEIRKLSTHDVVLDLKAALVEHQSNTIKWRSQDGMFQYIADTPVDPLVDVIEYADLPWFQTQSAYNAWRVTRINIGRVGIETGFRATQFTVTPKELTLAHWEYPAATVDKRITDPLADIELQQNYSAALQQPSQPDLIDYAELDNAMYDLNIHTAALHIEAQQKWDAMTDTEKFQDRELRRKWMTEPERNETGHKVWWVISTAMTVVAVYVMTAEEALQTIEDRYNNGDTLLFYSVAIASEDAQQNLASYSDTGVKRLIPFSSEPWPDDIDNLTAAQKAAFERLR